MTRIALTCKRCQRQHHFTEPTISSCPHCGTPYPEQKRVLANHWLARSATQPGKDTPVQRDPDSKTGSAPAELVQVAVYSDAVEAARAGDFLEERGIPCVIYHEHETLNPTFTLQSSFNAIHLLVPLKSVDLARTVLDLEDGAQVETEDLLADFSDAELIDVVAHEDQWNTDTVRAARAMLSARGGDARATVPTDHAESDHPAIPQKAHPAWMALGFLSVASAGIPGLFIGIGYRYLKDSSPDGRRCYIYSPRTRAWGGALMIVSMLAFVAWLTFFLVVDLP